MSGRAHVGGGYRWLPRVGRIWEERDRAFLEGMGVVTGPPPADWADLPTIETDDPGGPGGPGPAGGPHAAGCGPGAGGRSGHWGVPGGVGEPPDAAHVEQPQARLQPQRQRAQPEAAACQGPLASDPHPAAPLAAPASVGSGPAPEPAAAAAVGPGHYAAGEWRLDSPASLSFDSDVNELDDSDGLRPAAVPPSPSPDQVVLSFRLMSRHVTPLRASPPCPLRQGVSSPLSYTLLSPPCPLRLVTCAFHSALTSA